MGNKKRCAWTGDDTLMIRYHDEEWGVPVHDDRILFEFLILEGAQAGLTWKTVLNKRENYRKAFHGFDPAIIARYDDEDIARLLSDPGIIRNRLKITGNNPECPEIPGNSTGVWLVRRLYLAICWRQADQEQGQINGGNSGRLQRSQRP